MIVVLDTLGSGHISHLGYDRPTTPALDALARDGVSFTGAVTPASYTVATIPSIMTGRLPNRHGVIGPHMRMREEEVTLAEALLPSSQPSLGVTSQVHTSSALVSPPSIVS